MRYELDNLSGKDALEKPLLHRLMDFNEGYISSTGLEHAFLKRCLIVTGFYSYATQCTNYLGRLNSISGLIKSSSFNTERRK